MNFVAIFETILLVRRSGETEHQRCRSVMLENTALKQITLHQRQGMDNTTTKNQSQNLLADIGGEDFNFERWAKAVKPQLIAALRGNFTATPQQWKRFDAKRD